MIALIGGILVGIYAQKEKGRTGVFWAIACIITDVLLYLLVVANIDTDPSPNADLAKRITSTFVTVIAFGIMILTLPSKKPKE